MFKAWEDCFLDNAPRHGRILSKTYRHEVVQCSARSPDVVASESHEYHSMFRHRSIESAAVGSIPNDVEAAAQDSDPHGEGLAEIGRLAGIFSRVDPRLVSPRPGRFAPTIAQDAGAFDISEMDYIRSLC